MKKNILFLLCVIVHLLGIAQVHDNRIMCNIMCDCHYTFHTSVPAGHINDTTLYLTRIEIYNDKVSKKYFEMHYKRSKATIPDSLNIIDGDDAAMERDFYNYFRLEEIAQTFKYGFIDKWSWSTNIVNGVDFSFNYVNTNSKTIKYIDIYFIIKNPVGDICSILYNMGSNVGHLRGVGPVEQYGRGVWKWDAACYTTADADTLYFTKIVLTYMDGTKYTLKKEIAYKWYMWDS